ncbi:protein Niban 1a [Silurus meridionalis]|uniref:protein Niban 1a n=1 Tax=Silurus meridionalis TaxID=175797 RepID=UPI001EEBC9B1|nr:protein Niban 1a [Silurus meridionalis]
MGTSSSLLDDNKYTFIKEWAQTELRNFSPIYKKQYSLAFLSHVHDELVQRKQEHTQLLKQRDPPPETEVLYQESVLYFCDNRKWKERFVVVSANYSLEYHESYETFTKGTPPLLKVLTTGGTILTTDEKYMEVIDRCFTDTDNVKEDFAPPVVGMPGQFPVYLRLPYQRDHYFCFFQEAKHVKFMSVLSDCIRHQNQDFLKKETFEVQAFIKAVQLYRQDKGYYESWDMMIGNDVQVLTNLTMADLLPSQEKDLLSCLKAKKMEKKRMWFATVEAVYNVVQETFMEGMAALNNECREATMQQKALMCSNMDQIMSSRAFLESKLRDMVAELATQYCKQHIEPRLSAVLEEIMGPISLGFGEARQVSESMMEHLCQVYQEGMTREDLQQNWVAMSKPDLQSCYEKVSGLKDNIQEFSYSNCRGLEHSTQIDIQQLVDNVEYTFGLLLNKSPQDNNNLLDLMVKAKNRVLKVSTRTCTLSLTYTNIQDQCSVFHVAYSSGPRPPGCGPAPVRGSIGIGPHRKNTQYDYDSSTQRKRIFQEALLSITLPRLKAFLAPTFKKELPNFEQYIFADYVDFINVENVYEDILEQMLEKDVSKVVKEAASMQKYNLFMESRYRFSVSSMYFTPPGSPDYTSTSTKVGNVLPPSPLLKETQCTNEDLVLIQKKVELKGIKAQIIEVQEHAQPELTEVRPKKIIEQKVIMAHQEEVPAHAQTELIKIPFDEKTVLAEKRMEQEVIKIQEEAVEMNAQSVIIMVTTNKIPVLAEKKVEQEVIVAQQLEDHVQPELTKVPIGENTIMAEKMIEQKVIMAHQEEVLEATKERKLEDNEGSDFPFNAATEIRARFPAHETTQSLGKKTYSGPPLLLDINPETLLNPSISNTEPALKPASHTLFELVPNPIKTVANETPCQACPPERETRPMGQVLQNETLSSLNFISAESKAETSQVLPSCLDVQPLILDEQTNNDTGDTKLLVDDLTSIGAPIYELRVSNMTQDFYDCLSWSTSKEQDSNEDDEPTLETSTASSNPEDIFIVKCEAILDASVNVTDDSADLRNEAARPLDCIKEIRDLVVEVIEVEDVVQHYPTSAEVSLNTQ